MELGEFKQSILDNNLADDFLVFVTPQNTFLAHQYITKICENKLLNLNLITSIYEPLSSASAFLTNLGADLNVLYTDTFAETAEDYEKFKNIIVVCNKIDSKIAGKLKKYILEIPTIEEWQILSLITTRCKGLSETDAKLLYEITNKDIYRIDNETDKISKFIDSEQKIVLDAMRYAYQSDLYTQDLLNLSNAIIKQDRVSIAEYFRHDRVCEIEPMALINVLLQNYRKILFINFNSGADLAALKISDKQVRAIKYYYKGSTLLQIKSAINFLSQLETKFKTGEIELPTRLFNTYIICRLLTK